MADEESKPPPKLRRPPSIMGDDGRVEAGRAARAAAKTPREGGVPFVEVHEENSGNYEGPALIEFRAGKTIPERVLRLEDKVDDIVKGIGEIKSDVKSVASSADKMVGRFENFMEMQEQIADRPRSDSIMRVVKQTATETTTATLAERVLDEQNRSRQFRRTFVLSTLKIAGGLTGAGGVGALIHWLAGKL